MAGDTLVTLYTGSQYYLSPNIENDCLLLVAVDVDGVAAKTRVAGRNKLKMRGEEEGAASGNDNDHGAGEAGSAALER